MPNETPTSPTPGKAELTPEQVHEMLPHSALTWVHSVDVRADRLRTLCISHEALRAERDKLAAFKAYVHKRLDDAGVPVDPPYPAPAEDAAPVSAEVHLPIGSSPFVVVRETPVAEAGELDLDACTIDWADARFHGEYLGFARKWGSKLIAEVRRLRTAPPVIDQGEERRLREALDALRGKMHRKIGNCCKDEAGKAFCEMYGCGTLLDFIADIDAALASPSEPSNVEQAAEASEQGDGEGKGDGHGRHADTAEQTRQR